MLSISAAIETLKGITELPLAEKFVTIMEFEKLNTYPTVTI